MAEFSKQWCDANDKDGMRPDFDIAEVAESIANEHYTPIVCEGYGFVAIAKDALGNILLGMPTGNSNEEGTEVEWKDYSEVVK